MFICQIKNQSVTICFVIFKFLSEKYNENNGEEKKLGNCSSLKMQIYSADVHRLQFYTVVSLYFNIAVHAHRV